MILIKTEQRDLDLGKFPSSQAVAASLESLFHGFPAPFLELKKWDQGASRVWTIRPTFIWPVWHFLKMLKLVRFPTHITFLHSSFFFLSARSAFVQLQIRLFDSLWRDLKHGVRLPVSWTSSGSVVCLAGNQTVQRALSKELGYFHRCF